MENALYHGIKTKRDGGKVVVTARRGDQNRVLLEVVDDGVGLTPYKLAKVREMLAQDSGAINKQEEGFGLENVNRRVKLYYGAQYGLDIESHYRAGTRVTVAIPENYQSG